MNVAIGIAILACLGSCYFAACQIALKMYSRSRLAELFEASGRGDRIEAFVEQAPKLMVTTGAARTCLNLLVLLAVLHLVTAELLPGQHFLWQYLAAFAVTGFLVSVFGVAVPVSLSQHRPERLLASSTRVLWLCAWIFAPIAAILQLLDPLVKRLGGSQEEQPVQEAISEEIRSVVEEHENDGAVDQTQKEMLEAVFELPSTTAGQIMTPRTDIQALDVNSTLAQVKEAILREGHSRIPVYQGSIDNVMGILYAKDMIRFLGSDSASFELRKVVREPLVVPESKSLRELLAEFKSRMLHMAIVLDEYGGTAGLVTIEDIIEELVGEIQDEYEPVQDAPAIRRVDERTLEVEARAYIDELNRELDTKLPEDKDYDTLGGFVFATLGHIPAAGESFEHQNLRFTITDAERTKVKSVRIEVLQPIEAPGHAETRE